MAIGVAGTNGANARRPVVLVTKCEIDCATTQHPMMVVQIARPVAQVAQNFEFATRWAAQVCYSQTRLAMCKVMPFCQTFRSELMHIKLAIY